MIIVRGITIALIFLICWQLLVWIFHLPPYILPGPNLVFKAWDTQLGLLLHETIPTLLETLLGLFFGVLLGIITAISMALLRSFKLWLLPLLVISQAIPTFAIAPLLVIWFGYGMASKIATTVLMLFFPVTSAFYDGLRRTEPGWLDLAHTMNATRWRTFWFIRIPAALPSLASGIRVAAVIAPIGAIVGEWVGASAGLGFLMLNANARMQIDLMFAALFMIMILALLLYFSIDKLLRLALPWQHETN